MRIKLLVLVSILIAIGASVSAKRFGDPKILAVKADSGDAVVRSKTNDATGESIYKLMTPSQTWEIKIRDSDDALLIRDITAGTDAILIKTDGTVVIRDLFSFTTSGRFGINTTSPDTGLDVIGNFLSQNSESNANQIRLKPSDGNLGFNSTAWLSVDESGSALPFKFALEVNASVAFAISTTSLRFHIRPPNEIEPDADLEVSDGGTYGGGSIHRASSGAHSKREIKSDIAYMNAVDQNRAWDDVKSLRHVNFRYKRIKKDGTLVRDVSNKIRKGLIYEDSPDSIKDETGAIIIDDRIVNLELALQKSMNKIEDLEAQVAALK